VLLVGAHSGFAAALTEALIRHRVFVGTTSTLDVLPAVIAAAPDLVLLVDDAARDSGREVIGQLAASPVSSVVPVAILDDDARLELRLEAFRHGAAAVIRRSASVDAIASEISRLVREIPERKSRGLGDIGEVTLEELVSTLAHELRSGILSVRARGAPESGSMRLVLGDGRPVSAVIDDFVKRMGAHVIAAEPLEYEFDERAGGTVKLFDPDTLGGGAPVEVAGLRVLLADDDTARADAIAQELRGRNAVVAVTDLSPSDMRFARLRELDPSVLLVGERQMSGPGYRFIQRLREDLRLRWASLLLVDWDKVWPDDARSPDVNSLLHQLHAMAEPERQLRRRATLEPRFEVRLETTGPGRLLRALIDARQPLRAVVHHPRAMVQVDCSDGLVVGSLAELLVDRQRTVEGLPALAVLVGLSGGRVRIERVEQAAQANVMATVDIALGTAAAETPPIPPSLPAPSAEPRPGWRLPARTPRWAPWALGGAGLGAIAALVAALLASPRETPAAKDPEANGAARARSATSAALKAARAAPRPADAPAKPSAEPEVAKAPAPAPSAAPAPASAAAGADDPCPALASGVNGSEGREVEAANRALGGGDVDGAMRWYCVGISRTPHHVEALLSLSRLLLQRGDPKTALLFTRRALTAEPDGKRARMLEGDALARLGDGAGAAAAWAAVYEVSASDQKAMGSVAKREFELGVRATKERRHLDASRFYQRASTLQPQNLGAAIAYANALLMAGDNKEAARAGERATELNPRSVGALLIWAEALARTGDRAGSRRALERVLMEDPRNPEARIRLAQSSP
jgi:DNA-binding NarL/FixJ family response regulator/tetratricopeptide (TPR) repeat protein